MIKISILLLYRSIFPGRRFSIATMIVGALVIGWGSACLLTSILSCVPISVFWDITRPSTCIDKGKFFLGNSIPNIAMDVLILMLPMRHVWYLQLSLRQKFAVSGLFLLGGL